MENTYTFCLQTTANDLQPEISAALRAYVDAASRKKLPQLWSFIDSKTAADKRSPGRTAFMSTLCLGLGIFLLVPGLVKPQELMVPLMVGALAVGAGIGGFIRLRREKKQLLQKRFDKSAKKLLRLRAGKENTTVVFAEDGLELAAPVRYGDMDLVLETATLFLFFWGGQVLMVQKKELLNENAETFADFIRNRVPAYQRVEA